MTIHNRLSRKPRFFSKVKAETCKFTINNDNNFYDSYLFTSSETTTIKFPSASNLACQATFVAIGGGGYSSGYDVGGGSGYLENVVIDISSTEFEMTVGSGYGEDSFVKNNDGETIINALQGGKSYPNIGGRGYSGGGGQGSKGGSNGSDGEGENGGSGSGRDISEIALNHFVLSSGDGGENYGDIGGGGGGILVDNCGPDFDDYFSHRGKGYGGGGSGFGASYYGLPGMVLIEVKPM